MSAVKPVAIDTTTCKSAKRLQADRILTWLNDLCYFYSPFVTPETIQALPDQAAYQNMKYFGWHWREQEQTWRQQP